MEGSRRRSSYPGGSRPLGAGRPGDAGRRPVRPALHQAGEMGETAGGEGESA